MKKKGVEIMDKNLKYYLSLNYPLILTWDKTDKIYIVEYPDMPGLSAHGKTERAAIALAERFKKEWLKDALSAGLTIPEPPTDDDYSGRFVFRTSPANHRRLSERAKAEGKSLNSYMEMLTSEKSNAITIEKEINELKKIADALSKIQSPNKPLLPVASNLGGKFNISGTATDAGNFFYRKESLQ